jgi:prepilin-type processing-associated H-X9-DG protein
VELLVVIAIIGVLVALLLPAIQSARETARRTQCNNHLKQLGLAALNFENTHKGLPPGGWGWRWTGDPDRLGRTQPGGWLYSILAHLEGGTVYTIGKGLPPMQKKTALLKQLQTPIPTFHCPSRRPVRLYYGPEDQPHNTQQPADNLVCKTDYAANGGNYCPTEETDFGSGVIKFFPGPGSPTDLSCLDKYPNCNWGSYTETNVKSYMNGAVTPRFPVELRQITDGTSHTVFAAEKFLHPDYYDDGFNGQTHNSCSDTWTAFQGYDWDVIRWGNSLTTLKKDYTPRPDNYGNATTENCVVRFGGPHNGVFNGVYCDGSVRAISFDVDPLEWELACVRNDDGAIARPTPTEPPTERP